jgi:hypothetical protein
VVWCCGGMCVCIALALSPAIEGDDDTSVPGLVDVSSLGARGSEVEVWPSGVRELERVEGGREGVGRRTLCRDEWECQFCGTECFCKYQVFSEHNGEE